jgi:hypothetical protein
VFACEEAPEAGNPDDDISNGGNVVGQRLVFVDTAKENLPFCVG